MSYKWKRLQKANGFKPPSDELVRGWMANFGIDEAAAREAIANSWEGAEYWINDLYQVELRRIEEEQSVWLCIRRRDGYPGRDWRHFQQIKNELVGEECEAVELYPAESRLVDTSNKYHLFCSTDPTFRFPFGYRQRDVNDATAKDTAPGMRQSPRLKVE